MKALDMVHTLVAQERKYRQVDTLSHYCNFETCDEFYSKIIADPYSLHLNEPAPVPMYMMFVGKHHVCVKSCTLKCTNRVTFVNICRPYSIVETSQIRKNISHLPKNDAEYNLAHGASLQSIMKHIIANQPLVIQVLWSHMVFVNAKISSTFSDGRPCHQCDPQKKVRTGDHALTIILTPHDEKTLHLLFVDHAANGDVQTKIIFQIFDYMSELFPQFALQKEVRSSVGISIVSEIHANHPGWCMVMSWLGALVLLQLKDRNEDDTFTSTLKAKLANLYSMEFGNFDKYVYTSFRESCLQR